MIQNHTVGRRVCLVNWPTAILVLVNETELQLQDYITVNGI